MFCPNCGTEVNDNAAVCTQCDSSIKAAPAEKIENHLVGAILVTLFCCIPFGIIAIVNAAQVNTKIALGDIVGARESAAKAQKWIERSLAIGLIIIVLNTLLRVVSVAMANC